MSKSTKGQGVASNRAEEEAVAIARGIQKPGQTKEQTKLIAQGIKKGIELYKKQQSAKSRDLDKRRKQAMMQKSDQRAIESPPTQSVTYKQHWLPWLLLVLSWMVFLFFYV